MYFIIHVIRETIYDRERGKTQLIKSSALRLLNKTLSRIPQVDVIVLSVQITLNFVFTYLLIKVNFHVISFNFKGVNWLNIAINTTVYSGTSLLITIRFHIYLR